MTIFEQIGWLAPAIMAIAQGERSVCNWDEDALSMAVEAARDCLLGVDRAKVDGVHLCSTTLPYADRQNAGILATALNLGSNMSTADFTASVRSGTSGLIAALDAVRAGRRRSVLVAASDKRQTRGGYFYESWFGDGAASLLVGDQGVVAEILGSHSVSYDLVDHYRGADKKYDYLWEERWVRDEGYAKIIPEAIAGLLARTGLAIGDFARVVYPCFFTSEHKAIAQRIGATGKQVMGNMHEETGETGSAHPLVMFVRALEEAKPGDKILVASFGQGSDALAFQVTDEIAKLAPRTGIRGALARKRELTSYTKFAKFREFIDLEMSIRGEVGGQTAMTTLYRNRQMVLGLVGGKCSKCGVPQFPPSKICVNPECSAFRTQEPYAFADREGHVVAYTGDLLAVTVDPPAIYGIVQIRGGGRLLLDFTDCTLDDVKVGGPVRMSFRKRWYDRDRGYTGYFWKAVPTAAA
jgi:3-hydroxy-3-methylglutaryl CoA synthase